MKEKNTTTQQHDNTTTQQHNNTITQKHNNTTGQLKQIYLLVGESKDSADILLQPVATPICKTFFF
jgi:hypothetical protein